MLSLNQFCQVLSPKKSEIKETQFSPVFCEPTKRLDPSSAGTIGSELTKQVKLKLKPFY